VHALDPFEQIDIDIQGSEGPKQPRLRLTGMPGKHVQNRVLQKLNTLAKAVRQISHLLMHPDQHQSNKHPQIPPTNGWMLELGHSNSDFTCGYRIYITGDTLLVDELNEIPKRYAGQKIDLMLAHLGGTTIPPPLVGSLMEPLALMVTMDAEQGLQLMHLIRPELTIPIHHDDYDVFASSLEDFRRVVQAAGLEGGVVVLNRGEEFRFLVRGFEGEEGEG
jgi:hypothetical protein